MLFFGHIGITVGVFKAGGALIPGRISKTDVDKNKAIISTERSSNGDNRLGSIDYRLVTVGSMLPDIIDKPVFLILRSQSLSGRDYAHSLLFSLTLFTVGLIIFRYRISWVLVLAASSFIHLICDQMWNEPVTLFWPLLGPLLPGERDVFLRDVFYNISTPRIFIPEIIGIIILAFFAVNLVKRKSVRKFISSGALNV